jgi:hypothetical protein
MQIGAYAHAVTEQQGLEIKGGIVIHTNSSAKKGIEGLSAKVRTAKELDLDFQNFMKVYEVWNINPTATAPKVFAMPVYMQWQEKKAPGFTEVTHRTPAPVAEPEPVPEVSTDNTVIAQRIAERMQTDTALTPEENEFFLEHTELIQEAHARIEEARLAASVKESELPLPPAPAMPDKAPVKSVKKDKYPNALDKKKAPF